MNNKIKSVIRVRDCRVDGDCDACTEECGGIHMTPCAVEDAVYRLQKKEDAEHARRHDAMTEKLLRLAYS